ncbi:putative transmembrane protein [Cedratvirus kamchatka]|uniref:Transmembrane protein n=1 Tax=Cedratvirus kamchatka TaxID=2716914 RepID=A0A6G8MYC6_9VIRU|nr:putative transmembrane protein [Cedratvirus kamchatka]
MNKANFAEYLSYYLPFYVPRRHFIEYLFMSKEQLDRNPPIDPHEVGFIYNGDKVHVHELCPEDWFSSYYKIQEELQRYPDNLLQGRFALGWYLTLLSYYKPNKRNYRRDV